MWRTNDGFFLSDLLLSLSALGVAAMFLIPSISFIWQQTEKTTISNKATEILYNELTAYASEGVLPIEKVIQKENGTVFKVYVLTQDDGNKEVCVRSGERTADYQEICGKIE
jgi:competence protein ComGE